MDMRDTRRRIRAPHRDLMRAWAAGFFDGEGTTSCATQNSGSRSLMLSVAQVNRNSLERFQVAVDGVGNISRPYDRGNRPISIFRAYGPEAVRCAQALWPFLSREKQDQALRAILAYAFRPVSNRAGQDHCKRGHSYAVDGTYHAPDGSRECARCRQERRKGSQPQFRPLAIDRGIGVRQYQPAPLVET